MILHLRPSSLTVCEYCILNDEECFSSCRGYLILPSFKLELQFKSLNQSSQPIYGRMSTCFGKFFFKYLRVSTNQKIFFLGDLITFIWKTRWIYMVEEFINILRVSAISCLFSVSSITGEKTSSFKTIFANLNIFGILN